jgi:hypothetical protein
MEIASSAGTNLQALFVETTTQAICAMFLMYVTDLDSAYLK